jgi:hypothetical protein
VAADGVADHLDQRHLAFVVVLVQQTGAGAGRTHQRARGGRVEIVFLTARECFGVKARKSEHWRPSTSITWM